MIEKVRIRNFQSWEDQTLELEPFTVIVGDSDVGKSAFIRAISAFQAPLTGMDFVKHGASKASVQIWFDGHELKYAKGKGVNRYVLDGDSFEKAGRSVPEEITEVFDITPEKFKQEKVSLNIDGQFDAPFLLFVPGTTVSQVIGAVLNLNMVFLALYMANSDVNKLKLEISSESARLEDFTKNLLNCFSPEGISFVNTKLTELGTLEGSYNALKRDVGSLQDIWGRAKREKSVYAKCGEPVELPTLQPLETAEKDAQEISVLTRMVQNEQMRKKVLEEETLEVDLPEEVSVDTASVSAIRSLVSKAQDAKREYAREEKEAGQLEQDLEKVGQALDELVAGLDLCPLTGLALSEQCKESISE